MKQEQCPICYSNLEVIECAPCHDCGHQPREIHDFQNGVHKYNTWEVYKGLRLKLCDFCDVDFGSYVFDYWGLDNNKRIEFHNFKFVKQVHVPNLEMDKYCSVCYRRLKFLIFLRDVRELIAEEKKHQ